MLFLILFSTFLLPVFTAVRVPLNQVSPATKVHLITGDAFSFLNTVKYCHNYPDIVCYERTSNGWTTGDESALTFTSDTDWSGLGSLQIQFPRRHDSQNNEANGSPSVNGLFHCYNYKHIFGIRVIVTSFDPSVRFRDGTHLLYVEIVPKSRWNLDLFIDFSGIPDEPVAFAVVRSMVWSSAPTYQDCLPGDPTGESVHDEL